MPELGEYYEKYQYHELCKNRMFDFYWSSPQNVRDLVNRADQHEELFDDMLFAPESITGRFIAIKEKSSDTDEWEDTFMDIPEQLEDFSTEWFVFSVEDLGGSLGCYSSMEYKLSVSPECVNRDDVILHEMIHLHEAVLDGLPTFYHDAVLYCLYKKLQGKVSDLDDRIEAHGHILNEHNLGRIGGRHDMLFLLKSFDLDLRMGYPLGTVFGYGMADDDTQD